MEDFSLISWFAEALTSWMSGGSTAFSQYRAGIAVFFHDPDISLMAAFWITRSLQRWDVPPHCRAPGQRREVGFRRRWADAW